MINRGAAAYWIPAFAGMTPNVTRVRPTSSHCGRGRIASSDAIRVRGCGTSMDLDPSPQPSPTRGEGANHRCRQINFPVRVALALTQRTGCVVNLYVEQLLTFARTEAISSPPGTSG